MSLSSLLVIECSNPEVVHVVPPIVIIFARSLLKSLLTIIWKKEGTFELKTEVYDLSHKSTDLSFPHDNWILLEMGNVKKALSRVSRDRQNHLLFAVTLRCESISNTEITHFTKQAEAEIHMAVKGKHKGYRMCGTCPTGHLCTPRFLSCHFSVLTTPYRQQIFDTRARPCYRSR